MKIYTKTGDDGTTGLFGGGRVSKDDLRVEAYGTADELNALLGVARAAGPDATVDRTLTRIQVDLFVLGAELATNPGHKKQKGRGVDQVFEEDVQLLEADIDRAQDELPPLTSFILPGGTACGAALHHARVVCRRAERCVITLSKREPVRPEVIRYLNRLADLLFVLARLVSHRDGRPETPWLPPR